MEKISTSLIVSTYNWQDALYLCLLSIKNQNVMPDEIIIADDGSTKETKKVIDFFKKEFQVPLIHVWQADNGFQLSQIRNKAIAVACKEYIIQIDGDLILHKKFVSDHINFAKRGCYATGSRVMISKDLSEKLLQNKSINISILNKGLSNKSNGFRIDFLKKYLSNRYRIDDIYYMRGCNMAFWRDDLLQVNGYNEDFIGWGREDNEIAIRLINAGISKRVLKFAGVVYHIYHKERPRMNLDKNDEMLMLAMNEIKTYTTKGIDQYLKK